MGTDVQAACALTLSFEKSEDNQPSDWDVDQSVYKTSHVLFSETMPISVWIF